ncbi:MAG: hypothetical protein QNJ34_12760 [Xenococcaceae cyanobacterium MO_188.B29]|nr:hypothetical protein [Xenococcaceae cyanobacterium MO_188.B29]
MPYSIIDRLCFFGRETERESIINKLITHRLTILYGASGVGKSSVLRAGVNHYFRQAAQENVDIKGKPGLGVIVFPPMEGNLKGNISWDDPISGIKKQLKVEMQILGIKEAPSENLSLTDTLKAWIEIIRDDTGRSRLFIILDQFEEYFLFLLQQNSKNKAPLHKFAEEFPKAVNDLELSVNFLIVIREDSLSKIDYFKREIPNLFRNRIEIAPLNRDQAKEAIEKPIYEYNRQTIILDSLYRSRLTVLSGDRNTHKSTLLREGIISSLRQQKSEVFFFDNWHKEQDWLNALKPSLEGQNYPFIILDQFEKYLQERTDKDKEGKVIQALSDAIENSPVNILVAMREQELPKLENLGNSLPSVKYLYLFKDAKGIDRIAEGSKDKPSIEFDIKSDLIEAILADDYIKSKDEKDCFEAPYLQLVMTRLWNEARRSQAVPVRLQKTTYKQLGGAAQIVTDHHYQQIDQLSERETETAARIFYFLVTPSSTQLLALTSQDLTDLANDNRLSDEPNLQKDEVDSLLDKLSRGYARILTPVGGGRYQIFFPGLADAVLRWVESQRQIKYLGQVADNAIKQFESSQLKALLTAMKAGQWLSERLKQDKSLAGNASTEKVIETLQTILQDIREKNEFEAPKKSVSSVNFSPDGQKLAIGAYDGTIQLWDVHEQKLYIIDDKEGSSVYYVCFSPEGTKLAASKGLGTIYLWDLQNYQQNEPPFIKLKGGCSPFYFLSFSGDSQKLAAGAGDGTPYLWDLQSQQQQPLAKGEKQDNPIYCVSLSPNGQMLATSAGAGPVILWKLEEDKKKLKNVTGNYQGVSQLEAGIFSVAFSPKEPMRLAAGSADGTVYLWNLEDVQGKPTIFPRQGEAESIAHIDFTSKGDRLVTVSLKGRVCLWNLQNNQTPQFTTETTNDLLYRVSFSADGKQLAIVQWDGKARLWDLQPRKREQVIKKLPGEKVTHISFNPNREHGQQLAMGFADGKVMLYELDKEDRPSPLPSAHRGAIYGLRFSSDGKQLATASADGTFQVYDLESKVPISFQNIKKSPVYGISFSYDGKQLFTGSGDGMVRLWDLGQRKLVHQFRGHQGPILHLSVSPDGEKLATASVNGTVRLWNLKGNLQDNLKDEKPSVECKGHQRPVYWVSFSQDSEQLATASGGGRVRLWNLEGNELDKARCIHPAPVFCVNFIPDTQELVTACWDGKVRLWSLQGKLLGEFIIDREGVLCVSPSFDGKLLATVSDFWNGKAHLLERLEGGFDKRIKDLLHQGCEWLEDYFAAHPEVRQ